MTEDDEGCVWRLNECEREEQKWAFDIKRHMAGAQQDGTAPTKVSAHSFLSLLFAMLFPTQTHTTIA
jgi:hypothetical protein